MKCKFMIVGGNYVNKGAQAMVFVTVDELRKRFPDCEIHVYSELDYRRKQKNLRFDILDDSFLFYGKMKKAKYFFVALAKALLGRPNAFKSICKYMMSIKSYTAMLDISGYCINSNINVRFTKKYLDTINLMRKYNVPVFLMQQSMGPIDFQDKSIKYELADKLRYPSKIFIREKDGFDLIKDTFDLSNLIKMNDLVLLSKSIDWNNIFRNELKMDLPTIISSNKVAIVPNMRNFQFSEKEKVIKIYERIINQLLFWNKKVYLVRHSEEDIVVCRNIKEKFENNKDVILIENDFDSYEYEEFISTFDFIVASRFHSIVHAYKRGVPCLVLGWAIKYIELAKLFKQSKYVFDVKANINEDVIIDALTQMNDNYEVEKKIIIEKLDEVQRDNSFEIVENVLKERYL